MNTTELLDKFSEQNKKLDHLKHQLAVSQAEQVEIKAIIAEKDRQIAELRAQIARINDLQKKYDNFVNVSKAESVEEIVRALLEGRKISLALAESLRKLTYTELTSILPALTE